MRAALAVIALGALGLVIEGALVTFLPALLLPDLALVLGIAAALFLPGGASLVALAGLGFAADLLMGAPLGLHVLTLMVPFAATRIANGSLELRRGMPEAVLVAVLTPVAGLATMLVLHLRGISADFGLWFALGLVVQTVVNAALAPAACALVESIAAATGELDPTRRGVAWMGSAAWTALRRHG
jgi:cell shape-determining protein MreD